jgi:hypothetical protein
MGAAREGVERDMGKVKLAAAAIILIVAIWGSIMVPPALMVPVRLWPGGPDAPIPAFLMPVLGLMGAWAAYRLLRGTPAASATPEADRPAPPADALFALLAIAIAALAVLVLVAVDGKAIDVPKAALLLVCGTLALIAGAYALAALKDGEAVELSSHWGGLGGGLGGWRLSPVTTMLLLTLIFLGTAVAVGGGRIEKDHGNETKQGDQTNTIRVPPPPAPPGGNGSAEAVNAAGAR